MMEPVWHERLWILGLSVLLECLYSEVPTRVHPVVWTGRVTTWLLRAEPAANTARFVFGCGVTLALAAMVVLFYQSLQFLTQSFAAAFGDAAWTGCLARIGLGALLLHTTFSVRGLVAAGARMRRELGVSLTRAREALRHLCSRDPSNLESNQLIAGTLESLVENTCDAFVAPLLFFALGGVPAALAYRAVNTLDSMIGYRGRYEYTGKFAARLDDVLNWLPARLSAVLLLTVAGLRGFSARRGIAAWRTQAHKTDSPNAGVTMSVTAGLLGVTLEKPGAYALCGGTRVPTLLDIQEVERWLIGVFILSVGLVGSILAALQVWGPSFGL
jgi:adenosylcobinamide-phosphate synthase